MLTAGVALAAVLLYLLWPSPPTPAGQRHAVSSAPALPDALTFNPALAAADAGELVVRGSVRDAQSESPVPGATVELLPASEGASVAAGTCPVCGLPLFLCRSVEVGGRIAAALRAGSGQAAPIATASTDAEGKYALSARWRGPVLVRARTADGRSGWARVGALEVDEVRVDLVVAALRPVVLHVVDETGAAVARARVLVASPADGAWVEGTSDASGDLEVPNPGDLEALWVYVVADGFAPASDWVRLDRDKPPYTITLVQERSLEVLTRAGGKPIDAQVTVELEGHPHRAAAVGGRAMFEHLSQVDVGVEATAPGLTSGALFVSLDDRHTRLVLDLKASARALVEVLDADGQPAADANLTLRGGGVELSEATSNDGALVVFGPLGEGAYTLEVEPQQGETLREKVTLKPGDNPITVRLKALLVLEGRVESGGGALPEGIEVHALGGGDLLSTLTRGPDNAFRILVQAPGPWRLLAGGPALGKGELTATAPATGLIIELERKAGVRVRVTSEGRPVAGTNVSVRPESQPERPAPPGEDEDPLAAHLSEPGADLETDAAGVAEAWGLDPGKVSIEVRDFEHRPEVRTAAVESGRATEVEISLERGASIEGVVLGPNGSPAPGANVTVWRDEEVVDEDETRGATADAKTGTFHVWGLERGKRYRLIAETQELRSKQVGAAAGSRGVKLELEPLPKVRGRVVDEAHRPIASFTLNGKPHLAADGRFELQLTRTTVQALQVAAEGYRPNWVNAVASPEVGDVVLKRLVVLKGRVIDGAGRPVSGAEVECNSCDGGDSDDSGAFALECSEARYPLWVRAAHGDESGLTQVDGPGEVAVRLEGKTRVTGRAFDLRGKPWAGVVSAELVGGSDDPDDARVTFRSDAAGRFTGEVARGVWEFTTRDGVSSTIAAASGPTLEVSVGPAPGTCALAVSTPDEVMVDTGLVSAQGLESWLDKSRDTEHRANGLPCGPTTLRVLFTFGLDDVVEERHPLDLKPPLTRFKVSMPRARAADAGR